MDPQGVMHCCFPLDFCFVLHNLKVSIGGFEMMLYLIGVVLVVLECYISSQLQL